MNKTSIISFFILILFLGIGSSWVINKANESNSIPPPVMKKIPDFNLINYDGKPFSRDSLLNKISVIDFIFTSCPGPCPIMSKNMKELYNQYKLHPDLQFISISVDPDYDNRSFSTILNRPLFLVPSGKPCVHNCCRHGGPSFMTSPDTWIATSSVPSTAYLLYKEMNSGNVAAVPSSL